VDPKTTSRVAFGHGVTIITSSFGTSARRFCGFAKKLKGNGLNRYCYYRSASSFSAIFHDTFIYARFT